MSGAVAAARALPRLLHPSLAAGAALVALVALPAALSLLWLPYPPGRIDILHRLAAPGWRHPMGTDPFGRDLLSIVLAGARNSLLVCLAAVLAGAAVGILAGLAGAAGGWRAALVNRIVDLLFAFPPLLVAAMVEAARGPGIGGEILAIALFNVPAFARMARGVALGVLAQDFVAAARVAGRGPVAILRSHVLPNIAPTLLVQLTAALAVAVLVEAGLSYLALGMPPPLPSLGRALADYQGQIFSHPALVVWPGLAVSLLVLGFNLLGDGLRDLLDPQAASR